MVLHRNSKRWEHRRFSDILEYLHPVDALVLNDTKVVPFRLVGKKAKTGGKVECLLVERLDNDRYRVLLQPSRGVHEGSEILFPPSQMVGKVMSETSDDKVIQFNSVENVEGELLQIGKIPLPPYIRREVEPMDDERYQTVYAKREGAIAAPTAGLHFTDPFLQSIMTKGVRVIFVTLHVGPGTFLPVRSEDPQQHRLWPERVMVSEQTASQLNETRRSAGRIIAVGTTSCRVLESSIDEKGKFQAREGKTSLFITPGFEFRAIDGLVTNFHLPKTTLLMLVSAFAGREWVLESYQEAIRLGYRFYSYGDAMVIF